MVRVRGWVVCAAAGVVLVTGGCAAGESRSDAMSFELDGDRLTVEADEVSVRLEPGGSGRTVEVDRVLSGNAAGSGNADWSSSGSTLRLSVGCTGVVIECGATHVVKVPEGVSVEVKASGGVLEAADLSSALSVHASYDGSVRVDGHSGPLRVTSVGGDIEVSQAKSVELVAEATADADVSVVFAAPPTKVDVRASGKAEVVLPAGPETYRIDGAPSTALASNPDSERSVSVGSHDGEAVIRKAS